MVQARKINGSRQGVWMILWTLCLLLSACTFNVNLGPKVTPLKEKVVSGEGEQKVLLVEINGVITNRTSKTLLGYPAQLGAVERIREILKLAEEDGTIQALWLRINSPGGTVTASDMVYHEIVRFKNKQKIKVYVSIMDLGASGAYYISVAGDQIFAHPTSLIGSIGVIALKPDLSGLMEKVGVGVEVVKSGDKKDFLSPLRPFTKTEREMFQATIDSMHRRFVGLVAANREGMDVPAVQRIADGRILTAQQALESGLIDRIGYLDEVLDFIKEDLKNQNLKVVTYHRSGEHKDNIYSQMNNPSVDLNPLRFNFLPDSVSPHFMYLWMP